MTTDTDLVAIDAIVTAALDDYLPAPIVTEISTGGGCTALEISWEADDDPGFAMLLTTDAEAPTLTEVLTNEVAISTHDIQTTDPLFSNWEHLEPEVAFNDALLALAQRSREVTSPPPESEAGIRRTLQQAGAPVGDSYARAGEEGYVFYVEFDGLDFRLRIMEGPGFPRTFVVAERLGSREPIVTNTMSEASSLSDDLVCVFRHALQVRR